MDSINRYIFKKLTFYFTSFSIINYHREYRRTIKNLHCDDFIKDHSLKTLLNVILLNISFLFNFCQIYVYFYRKILKFLHKTIYYYNRYIIVVIKLIYMMKIMIKRSSLSVLYVAKTKNEYIK